MIQAQLRQRYVRDVVLGQGGMGTVFAARDLRTGKQVAVKALHAGRSSPENLVRFKREFRAAARLTHPHCLPVFEMDRASDGQWFYAMEYAAGGHLHLQSRRSWHEVVQVGLQVLAALDHIHSKRIVHRDIKPQNILIHAQGEGPPWVKLADFGISKVVDVDDEVGAVLGSLGYLAPEQLEGRADPRSDLYALGLVLYEAMAGSHPFKGAMVEARTASVRDLRAWRRRYGVAFRPLRELAGEVPPGVEKVIMGMLAPRPQDRPATAAVVYEALSARVAPVSVGAGPLPPLSQTPYLSQATLVGRSGEARRLQEFSESVVRGLGVEDPVVLFVTGAAGTGKSRLLGELLRAADESDVRVEGGVWRDEGGVWALGSLLAALTASWTVTVPSVSVTVEEVGDSTIGWATAATRAGPEDPHGRYHQLGQALLELASRKPLLVLLEDAHWADGTSLELLAFLIRRVASSRELRPRVGFAISYRPSEAAEVEALYQRAVSLGAAVRVSLDDLGPRETVDLVCSMLSSARTPMVEQLGQRLHASSQGNPLLLGQTLQLLLTDGKLTRQGEDWHFDLGDPQVASLPRSLQEAVGDRAARLSLDTKKALAAAAVIGREVVFETLHQVSQMDSLLLLDCVDEALRAEFLTEHLSRPSVFQFVHDRVRDAIVSRLGEKERIELHRRTAGALEARRLAEPEVEADLGYHLRAAGELAAAEAAYTRAGQDAGNAQAYARAADLFGEALSVAGERGEPPSDELVEQHADACLQCGRYQSALVGYHQRLLTASDPLQRAQLLRRCADAEWRRGNTAASGEQMEDVLRALGISMPTTRAGFVRSWVSGLAGVILQAIRPSMGASFAVPSTDERARLIAEVCLRLSEVYYFSDFNRALHYSTQGFHRARRARDARLSSEAYSQQAYLLANLSLGRLGRRLIQPARDLSASVSGAEDAWNRILHGMCLGCCGDAQGYAEQLREAEALLDHSADPMKQRQVWALLGEALLVLGQVQEAEACGEKVLKLSTELGDDRGRGWGLYVCGWAAARLGDLGRGRALLAEAAVAAERGGDPVFRCCAQGRGAFAALLAGDLDEALSLSHQSAQEMVTRSLRHPTTANDGIFLAAAAAVYVRDGVLPGEVRWFVGSRRLRGRELARGMRLSAPLFWAGNAAWVHAQGHVRRGRRFFGRAVAIAQQGSLKGERQDVHALAARVMGGDEGREHARLAAALAGTPRSSSSA